MKNNNKVEIFAGTKAPDYRLGLLWLDTSAPAAKLKKLNKDGSVEILNPTIPPIPAPVELSTSLTETVEGKAADATVIKTLNDSKYPSLQNGTGNVTSIPTIETLVRIGFSLTRSNLSYSNLTNADLTNADLSSADLSYANLSYANLTNANLYYANLTGANLSYANLYRADFPGANLYSADLTNAEGLNSDINVALADVNKDPNGDISPWTLTWTDGSTYSCDPSTGLFTLVS